MKKIVGLFEREEQADAAITELQKAGFGREHFGLITRNRITEKVNRAEDIKEGTIQAESKLGASGGAAIGGLTGLLLGVGSLLIPGVGPVIAAGTIGAVIAAAGMGTVAGGLLGALTSMGITEEADLYAEGIKRGGILLIVEADDENAALARDVMNKAGTAETKTQRKVWQEAGWTGFDETTPPNGDH